MSNQNNSNVLRIIIMKGRNRNTIQHRIYNKLIKLVPTLNELATSDSMKVVGKPGMMDLHLDVLSKKDNEITIALSHYYKHPSGDMILHADMRIAIFPAIKKAEALSYQDIYKYQSVEMDTGTKLRKCLNEFLNFWLRNCLNEKYKLELNE